MKILFVGVLDVPWSTNIPMMRELQRRGHHVTAFNYRSIMNTYAKAADNFLNKWEKFYKVLNKPFTTRYLQNLYHRSIGRYQMNKDLLNEVKSGIYDLVLLAKADTVDWHTIALMNRYAKTWYFFMDWLPTAQSCDAIEKARVSTYASSSTSDVFDKFSKVNPSSFFLTQGVDKELFRPLPVKKDIDVCFVGSATKERVSFINYLLSKNISVLHYGPGTEHGPIYLDDLVTLFCRSKIVLNLNQSSVGFSNRVFQVLGTGTFLLSEYCLDLESIFTRKKQIDGFYTKDECAELVRHYLDNKLARDLIAKNGMIYVYDHFSWEIIMDKILEKVKESPSKKEIIPFPDSSRTAESILTIHQSL